MQIIIFIETGISPELMPLKYYMKDEFNGFIDY
jgi:hypothetical protein